MLLSSRPPGSALSRQWESCLEEAEEAGSVELSLAALPLGTGVCGNPGAEQWGGSPPGLARWGPGGFSLAPWRMHFYGKTGGCVRGYIGRGEKRLKLCIAT